MNTNSKSASNPLLRAAIFAALFLAVALPLTAWAHAKLLRSAPADKTEVAAAPKKIEIWFGELLDDKFNSIDVYPSAEINAKTHAKLTVGEPSVDARDRTHLTVALTNLPPGDYTVDWRVLSRDGHSAPGRFSFKVAAPPK